MGLGLFVWTFATHPALIARAATCTGTQVTGTAFRDYNFNGSQESGEPGLAGIVVTAYRASGVATSCETGANGGYGLDPSGGFPIRLEFTLPSDGHLNFLKPSVKGATNTSVTFLDGPTTSVNAGFNNPAQYCGTPETLQLVTSCFVFGEQNNNADGVNKDLGVLDAFPYTAGSVPPLTNNTAITTPAPTHPAIAQQIGSVWGLAWNPPNHTLYAAAFMKRHAGFGPNGPGAIYQIPSGGTPTLFFNFGALAGNDPHPKPGDLCGAGTGTNGNCWFHDSNAFDQVGKVGFGDLDISDDFKTLYTVNLATNALMAIPLANPAAAVSIPVPTPSSCPVADLRPFGLGVNDGIVYLGMVCSAESSHDDTQLRAYVYAFVNGAFATTPTLDFPLIYDRNSANLKWAYWLNVNTFTANKSDKRLGTPPNMQPKWAQPWLTNITFDHGDMILALRDRDADQFGASAGGPDPADTSTYAAISRGDILRACATGSGGWTLETNGQCGANVTAGAGNREGPGGGEYYFMDEQTGGQNPPVQHAETSVGSLLQVPGFPDVVSTIFNPIDVLNEVSDAGIKWYNNSTGKTTRGYRIFDGSGGGSPPPLFAKANGLGDLEALCDPAPLEIGNRVWLDTNADGIQDANEKGIDGVTLELYRNNVLVGRTTTANGGQYYFNDTNVTLNNAHGIVPGTGTSGGNSEYEVRIPDVNGVTGQAVLAHLTLTSTHKDNTSNGQLRDSDGAMNGGNATYAIPYADLLGPGSNNHTYDFGFIVPSALDEADEPSMPTHLFLPLINY